MRVLITGGAGFIGSHLCDKLLLSESEIVVLDNFSTGSINNIAHLSKKIKIINGSILDNGKIEKLIKKSDLVIHLAAAVGVFTILQDPITSISTNYHGSENVLLACAKFNKKIIIASTSEVYGKNLNQPLSETDDRVMGPPQKLRWTYADSKALEESLAFAMHLAMNLQVITVRFFNVVGPRQSGAYGMVLPRFVNAALSNNPIEIFGDGSQKRVFCHVSDVTSAIVKLVNCQEAIGNVFNIGGNEEIAIVDLAKLVKEQLDSKSDFIFTPYEDAYGQNFEDMQRRYPNLEKIKKFISWEPSLTLRDIITDIAQHKTKVPYPK